MAEANPSLRLNAAIVTLARQQAIKAVKRQYQAKGLKVHHFARRDIVMAANEYLREHRELIAEAAVVVEQWRKEGFFGKGLAAIQNPLAERAQISNQIKERSIDKPSIQ
jgi:hypothetical protein